MQFASMKGNSRRGLASVLIGLAAGAVLLAQTPKPATPAPAVKPAPAAPAKELPVDFTATSMNVNGAGEGIDFHIIKWSTDADRDQLSAAWSQAGAAPAPARGAGAGGRGGAAPAGAPDAPAAAANAAAGGRGGGARGAAAAAAPTPRKPDVALAAALKALPDVGYFWTSEVGGYLIRYAQRLPLPAGGSRIILLTDHRLGFSKKNWQPTGSETPNDYEFTLIELRLPATGEGEGKASLTGKLAIDPNTKMLALDGYDTLPVVMKSVKFRPKT